MWREREDEKFIPRQSGDGCLFLVAEPGDPRNEIDDACDGSQLKWPT